MEQVNSKEIRQIIAQMECTKDFSCYRSGFKKVCKAKDGGLEGYIWCLEDPVTARSCDYSLSFGEGMLCKCPVRLYLAKKLGA